MPVRGRGGRSHHADYEQVGFGSSSAHWGQGRTGPAGGGAGRGEGAGVGGRGYGQSDRGGEGQGRDGGRGRGRGRHWEELAGRGKGHTIRLGDFVPGLNIRG